MTINAKSISKRGNNWVTKLDLLCYVEKKKKNASLMEVATQLSIKEIPTEGQLLILQVSKLSPAIYFIQKYYLVNEFCNSKSCSPQSRLSDLFFESVVKSLDKIEQEPIRTMLCQQGN